MPTTPSGKPVDKGVHRSEPVTVLAERQRLGFDPVAALRLEETSAARGDWAEVARLITARADYEVAPDRKGQALARAAEIHRTRLTDRKAAFRLVRDAFAVAPADPAVARELESLGRESPVVAGQIRTLLADAAVSCELGAPDLAAELWLRAAEMDVALGQGAAQDAIGCATLLVSDPLSERAAAIVDRLEREATALPVLDCLADLCRRAGDQSRAGRAIVRSIEHSADMGDRSSRLRTLADLLRDAGDEDGAEWYEREAQRLSPLGRPIGADLDHDREAAILADRYTREKRWHLAEPVLDRLTRPNGLAAERLGLARADLHYHAARVALERGRHERAIKLYRDALEFDPVHLRALHEQARACAALGRWDDAHELCGSALMVQRSLNRPAADLAETVFQMGRAREKSGHPEAALTLYESALDTCPAHPEALDAACELHRAAGDLSEVARLLEAAIAVTAGAVRAQLQLRLAGLRSRFLSDAEGAIVLCRAAVAALPGDRSARLALAEHCQAAFAFEDSAAALAELAELENSPLSSGKYLQLAAAIAPPEAAVDYLERALDCFFAPGRVPPQSARATCMGAFEELERLLRGRRDFERLERCYRAMIKRLPAGAPELPSLWAGLGKIYRDHTRNPHAAIQSYEVASDLERDRLTHHRILIDLYQGVGTDELDKLVARRRKLLEAEPHNGDHYAALRSLWARMKQWDRTFAACRALVFLGRADRKEDEFYRRYRTESVVWPRRVMNETDWRRLRHPDEDALIGAVLGRVAEPLAFEHALTPRKLRLGDDASLVHDHVRHLYRNVCVALGVGTPRLFVSPWLEVDMVLANLRAGASLAPSFAVGRHMYEGRSSAQMVHGMARMLSYARPIAYLRLLFGGDSQLGGAMAMARAAAARPGSTEGATVATARSRLPAALERRAREPMWLSDLRGALRRLRERGGPVDLERWGKAADATARRAGLLLGGALDVAAFDLDREPLFAQKSSRVERVTDLLLHSVSDEHLGLRKDLGLALDD
jgi:tetratricopeptide (TPR) repeat protein